MLNGHEIVVTAEEIRNITFQVYGITLPPNDPRDMSALEKRVTELERIQRHAEHALSRFAVPAPAQELVADAPASDPRDEELAALRARVAELEARDASVFAEPVIQEPERARDELLDFDAEPVEELTGDQLLNAFEQDEDAAALLVQTLSALRQKHISEQLNVERARLDREHQATGVANPRSAQIDRLLGLLTRRGEV
jgi:hypothetical protein